MACPTRMRPCMSAATSACTCMQTHWVLWPIELNSRTPAGSHASLEPVKDVTQDQMLGRLAADVRSRIMAGKPCSETEHFPVRRAPWHCAAH